MNSKEILALLGLPNWKNNTAHASKLVKVYEFLKAIKNDLTSVEIISENIILKFGAESKEVYRHGEYVTETISSGTDISANKIKVATNYAEYSFAIPNNNSFYYSVCDIIGLDYEVKSNVKEQPINSVIIYSENLKQLAKAAKFVSKDELRPAMTHVCIAIDNCTMEIVSTDAHKLYMSGKTESSDKQRIELLISAKDAQKIANINFSYELTELKILAENRLQIEDFICPLLDSRFPDYRCVVPEYETYMEFNRKELTGLSKRLLPFANKCTGMLSFYMNGQIEATACEVDFGYETKHRAAYISKNFEDTTIGFNGKFLIECLNNFKDESLKMYTNGQPSKAVLLTNDSETILLMPLMN